MVGVRHRNSRAFTLVELLVVIGVIALLISMLMPALGRAREQAKTVQCMAQLRQIGNALAIYAGQNKGYYPGWSGGQIYKGDGTHGDDPGLGWTEQLERCFVPPTSPVYQCPGFPPEFRINYFLGARWLEKLGEVDGQHHANLLSSKVRLSSQFILSGDCTQAMLYPPPFGIAYLDGDDCDKDDATQEAVVFFGASGGFNAHKGGNNILFGDYHVATFKHFDPQLMTYNPHKMQDWASCTAD